MKKLFIISLLAIIGLSSAFAQTTITLYPKTSGVWNITPTATGGTAPDFIATDWTHSGNNSVVRSFMTVDLSSIPVGATITSATLSLYWHQSVSNTGHSTMSGSNASWLRRVTTPYSNNTVTWNTQPSYSTSNEVFLAETTNDTMSYPSIDVTNLINDIRNNPDSGYGVIFMLADEQYYRSMLFASSEAPEINKRPVLAITYVTSGPTNDTCITLKINNDEGGGNDCGVWNITPTAAGGTAQDFIATDWTHSGNNSIVRSIINFDLSSIPSVATITSATLSLYWHQSTSNTGHSTMSGSNASWLRRITTPYNYNIVTWNTQPSYSTINEVYLPETTNDTMSYPNIDVTNLINDIRNKPDSGYGMIFMLADEQYYRSMLFASSNAPEVNKRPVIEICYKKNTAIQELKLNNSITLYPNPASDNITVEIASLAKTQTISIYNIQGQLLIQQPMMQAKTNIDISAFSKGLYFLKVENEKSIAVKKFVKE
jgi:hypothetical protein